MELRNAPDGREDLLSLKILSHKKAYLSEMSPTYSYLCYMETLDYGTHQPMKTGLLCGGRKPGRIESDVNQGRRGLR